MNKTLAQQLEIISGSQEAINKSTGKQMAAKTMLKSPALLNKKNAKLIAANSGLETSQLDSKLSNLALMVQGVHHNPLNSNHVLNQTFSSGGNGTFSSHINGSNLKRHSHQVPQPQALNITARDRPPFGLYKEQSSEVANKEKEEQDNRKQLMAKKMMLATTGSDMLSGWGAN